MWLVIRVYVKLAMIKDDLVLLLLFREILYIKNKQCHKVTVMNIMVLL